MAQAIYRTYRPTTFSDVRGQAHVVKTLQNQFLAGSLAHAYLFTGPRGVGKTTTARLIAKLVNCTQPNGAEPCGTCDACVSIASGQALDVYEIDAASHTGVDNVRETVIDSVRFAPNVLAKKVYIIDEVHMLSTSAFNALLKTLEEPPSHALFVLATTEIHKVPETIISRCQRFDFKRIAPDVLVERMQVIVKEEGVAVDEDVLREIARHSGGCARDAESLLGQVLALGEKTIGMEEASLVLPATQTVLIESFVQALSAGQAGDAIAQLNTYLEQGVDLRHFVSDTIAWMRDRMLATVAGKESEMDVAFLQRSIEGLLEALNSIRSEQIPQLPVELAIVKLCGLVPAASVPQDFKQPEVVSTRPASVKPPVAVSAPVSDSSSAEVPPVVPVVEPEVPVSAPEAPPVQEGSDVSEAAPPVEPIDASETVFDTVPVISLEDVKRKWPQVYEQIKSCNASLPMMMKTCEVTGVDGARVELGFDYSLYVETVNQEKNRKIIEGVLEQVLGTPLRVRAVQRNSGADPDGTVNNLLEEFGGTVVN